MKTQVRNTRTRRPGGNDSWLMWRRVWHCEHSNQVTIDPTDRAGSARRLLDARRSLRAACDRQRADIRDAQEGGWM